MSFEVYRNDKSITSEEFRELFFSTWKIDLDPDQVSDALARSVCITAREHGKLIACVRLITDGYLSTSITEFMTNANGDIKDLAKALLIAAYEESPSGINFAMQRAPEHVMRELGWTSGPTNWFRRKPIT